MHKATVILQQHNMFIHQKISNAENTIPYKDGRAVFNRRRIIMKSTFFERRKQVVSKGSKIIYYRNLQNRCIIIIRNILMRISQFIKLIFITATTTLLFLHATAATFLIISSIIKIHRSLLAHTIMNLHRNAGRHREIDDR